MKAMKHLGRISNKPVKSLAVIPWTGHPIFIELDCTEFTSRCPVTHQPDFGSLKIRYITRGHIVETKSLKLWLWSYREKGAFNESIAEEIVSRFAAMVAPRYVAVDMRFHPRGGIAVRAVAERIDEKVSRIEILRMIRRHA